MAAAINTECGRCGRALHAACFDGHIGVVRLLVKAGAQPSVGGTFKGAPEAAFRGGSEDVAVLLIQEGNCILSQDDYDAAMLGAASSGFLRAIDMLQSPPLLLLYGKCPSQDKSQARTAKAIKPGQLNIFRRFLSQEADPQSLLSSDAVAIVSICGYIDALSYHLSDLKFNSSTPGTLGSPLRCAALMGYERVIRPPHISQSSSEYT